MANIFICGDQQQEDLLGGVAAALRDKGHSVVRGPANTVATERKIYDADERRALIGPADVAVFTNRHAVDRTLMDEAHRLRGICYPVTGVESLDLEAASKLGIIVGHGRVHGNAVGMAEATVMLMLMLVYNVQRSTGLIVDGGWGRPAFPIRSLAGKTVGIIGFGRIAREVAARLAAFDVRILAASPRTPVESLPSHVTKVDLPTLMGDSDVVSVLTGLTPETRLMIGADELALMKSSSVIVNTGRGEVIDETALFEALRDQRIAGAALDAFSVEPLPASSPLRTLDNVILTPHCVGHTQEGIAEFAPALVENVSRILAGELPLYCKNPEAEAAWRDRLARIGPL